MQVCMQIIFKIRKHFSLSTNSQANSKMSGYLHAGSVDDEPVGEQGMSLSSTS